MRQTATGPAAGHIPTLETERLVLRKLTVEDTAHVFLYASDPQVTRYLRWSEHPSLAATRDFLQGLVRKYESSPDYNWGIELKQTGWITGACALHCDPANRRAELGYVLAREYWNRGIVTEAVHAVLEFAFARTRLNRIEAFCYVSHAASARVLEKSGFQFEGVLREREFIKDRHADMRVYSILRSDFEKRQPDTGSHQPHSSA